MIEAPITEDSFVRIAMRYYDNPQCVSITEFEEDLKRFAYLKKLFGRYRDNQDLKERLILNHLIVLFNVFGVMAVELLFFKIDREHWAPLATFLYFLDRMPEKVPEFNIKLDELQLDATILTTLRTL